MTKAMVVPALLVLVLTVMTPNCPAAPQKKANDKKPVVDGKATVGVVTGMLFVARDESGKVTGATLSVRAGKKAKRYKLLMTAITQDVIKLDGANVSVEGEMRDTEDGPTLKVRGRFETVIPTIAGVLAAIRDDLGKVTGVTITHPVNKKTTRVYSVDMSTITQDLSKLEGKHVQVKGVEEMVGDKTMLKLKGRIEAASEPGAKESKDKPKDKDKDKDRDKDKAKLGKLEKGLGS